MEQGKLELWQLEQNLAQRIEDLYQNLIQYRPKRVDCKLTEQLLTITVENSVTPIERLLIASGKQQLAQEVRTKLHKAFRPQLQAVIEEVLQVGVIDIAGESKVSTGRTSIVAILAEQPPQARSA